jgi:cytochrome c556
MRSVYASIAVTVLVAACGSSPAAVPAPAPAPQPHANLAQLMRGIPFTFSNIVFDAQSEDPGAPKQPAEVSGSATATYSNVYGGWQMVENSALALSETANLLLVPGRVCENGKPVPIEQEEFQKAAIQLRDAGEAAYKAAQSKSMDAIVEVSGTVAEACAACHEPYRDFDNPNDRCGGAKAE